MDTKYTIEIANENAVERLKQGEPILVDIAPAGEVIPGLEGKKVIHSGPPIEWQHMCSAQRGAIIGQVIYEGWAVSIDEAKCMYKQRGGALTVVASVCGTTADPQDMTFQEKLLQEAGVLVYTSNARATAACCWLLGKGECGHGYEN